LKYQILILYLLTITTAYAQIVFDGTLGPVESLTGPDVVIEAEMGQQMGPNLFHSFKDFNINADKTATFQGPNVIQRVISRVTGGNVSYINGTLRSTMPKADMYFINPAGIIFGPSAFLDIPGSLYITTADYLRLGDNGRFDATEPANSILTVAPPAAFGFLDNTIGRIEIQDNVLNTQEGKTLTLVGGNINIENGHLVSFGGKIHLASFASQGEVPLNITPLPDNLFTKLGKIMITDSDNQNRNIANIDASGFGGGQIFIQAGQLILDNGYIFADTNGEQDGQGITIEVTNDVNLKNGALITTNTFLNATGHAGNISLRANQIHLEAGSQINSSSLDTAEGSAGDITITATEKLSLHGVNTNTGLSSAIFSDTISQSEKSHGGNIHITTDELVMEELAEIRAKTVGFGNAGDILVTAGRMVLKGGSQIIAGTGDTEHLQGSGQGGDLTLNIAESVLIEGFIQPRYSGFVSNTFTQGNGGTIQLSTPQLTIQNDGAIQTASRGFGDAGNILLTINNLALHDSVITTQAEKAAGGEMTIQINHRLDLLNSQISAEATGDKARDQGGNLTIFQPKFVILDHSNIFTRGYAGTGGNIKIIADQFLQTSDSVLDASSQLNQDGEIRIEAPETNIGEEVVILPKQLVTPKLPTWCQTQLRDDEKSGHFRQVNWIGIPRDELDGVFGSFLDL
jgi:filamentous hemagglutinin family protein